MADTMADGESVDGGAVVADPGPAAVPQTPAQIRMHRRMALMNAQRATRANVSHPKPKKHKKARAKRAKPSK